MVLFDYFADDENDGESELEIDQNSTNVNTDDTSNDDENDCCAEGECSNNNEKKEDDETSARIKELEDQVKNLQNLNLRLRAEFENFKKRTSKERQGLYNSAQIDCVSEFLPFFDGMERGFESLDKGVESEAAKGFKMLIDSFNQVLKKLNIESFGKKGDEFDPKIHNAIKIMKVEGFGSNLVYEVLQKGYCKGENVVRHAMVVVANP